MGADDRNADPEPTGPLPSWEAADDSAPLRPVPQPLPPLWDTGTVDPYAAVTIPAAAPGATASAAPNPITALAHVQPAADARASATQLVDERPAPSTKRMWRRATSTPPDTIDLTDPPPGASDADAVDATGPLPIIGSPPEVAADPGASIALFPIAAPLPASDHEAEGPAAPAAHTFPIAPPPSGADHAAEEPAAPAAHTFPIAPPLPTYDQVSDEADDGRPYSPLPTFEPATFEPAASDPGAIVPHLPETDPTGPADPGDGAGRHAASVPPWRRALTGGALAVGAVVVGLVTANYWHAGGYPGHPANRSQPGPGPAVVGTVAATRPQPHRASLPTTSHAPVSSVAASSAPAGTAASTLAHRAAGTATVTVLNETAIRGLAEREAGLITAAGWHVRRTKDVDARYAVTTVLYDPGQEAQARLLLETVPSVKQMRLRPNIFLPTGGLIVIVASDAA